MNQATSSRSKGHRAGDDDAIIIAAIGRLETNSHFHHRTQLLRFESFDGCLVIHGRLPSFYLKQLVQTLLRNLDGVEEIHNRVDVT